MSHEPAELDVYRVSVPMRSFEHAAAGRDASDGVLVALRLADGTVGWGETHPRPYVTGETVETVVDDLASLLWPEYCRSPRAPLPLTRDGRVINAATCALELAHLDAVGGFAETGGAIFARVSGVIGSSDPSRTARQLKLMRLFGLRDFKLKIGLGKDIDDENLRIVSRRLARAISSGKCTLRADVNGGWDAETTPARTADLKALGVCVVEQPVFCGPEELAELASRCALPLMADESLITEDDARRLLAGPARPWWNVRLSKNGGYANTLRLARLAAANGVPFTFGCMVGESGILSAGQRRALQASPPPAFVEGNYGRFLLKRDLTRPSPRFGYGGSLRPLAGRRLGVQVRADALARCGQLVRHLEA
jgi:muconate cycloisomerase